MYQIVLKAIKIIFIYFIPAPSKVCQLTPKGI